MVAVMARYLIFILFPVFMATAHELPHCGSAQSKINLSTNDDAFFHQTPDLISRLKKYHDEVKLIKLELEGLYELQRINKKDVHLSENIKFMEQRLISLVDKISSMEEELRIIRRQLAKQISNIRYCNSEKVIQESYYRNIEAYLKIPDYKRLYVDHNDYGRYFFKLNVGYEYSSISGILKESSPRIGLLIYRHLGRMPYQEEYGFGNYGYQLFANLILSANTNQQISSTTVAPEEQQLEDTLGINISIYKPVLRNRSRPDFSHLSGFILNVGSKQNDETTEIQSQYYIGLRSAMSPEHYLDMMLGRSPGQDSRRLEIRGQMPVATLGAGSRFYIGMLANMGVSNKQDDENDVFSVYVSWNIDFLDLFTTGG